MLKTKEHIGDIKEFLTENKSQINNLKSLQYNNKIYSINEFVHLQFQTEETQNFENFYAQIQEILHNYNSETQTHYVFLKVNYFFSKLDLDSSYESELQNISYHELFKSDLIDYVSYNVLYDKIKIVSLKEFQESLEDQELKFVLAEINIKNGKIKPSLNTRNKVCICKKIENPDYKYIQCDECRNWFHLTCTGFGEEPNISKIVYKCNNCITNNQLLIMVKFTQFGFKPFLNNALKELQFIKPTEIQRKIIPLLMQDKDVIACAKTGSGKTLSYLLPLLNKLGEKNNIFGVRILVLVPTRELALQTSSVLKQLIKRSSLSYSLLIGGHDYIGQFESLASNPDILIATPGRLVEVLQETEFTLQRIECLVLDEADNFFEQGYKDQMTEIIELVNKDRQTILLSATIPESLKDFAQLGMREYVFAKIDSEYSLSEDLQSHFFIVKTAEKIPLLVKLLQSIIPQDQQVIVFVSTRYQVDLLENVLTECYQIKGSYLYGKMDLESRNYQLDAFRKKQNKILVVTDLCARGIDIPNVENVINFDFPVNIKIFIHRCGRTARAGKSGKAYSFFVPDEIPYVFEVQKQVTSKEIVNVEQKEELDCDKIYMGKINSEQLQDISSKLNEWRKINVEIKGLEKHAQNGHRKFCKTRFAWGKQSYEKSKEIREMNDHIFFLSNDQEKKKFVEGMKKFKPQQSLMELKDLKEHPNEEKIRRAIDSLKRRVIKKRKKDIYREKEQQIKKKLVDNFQIEFSKMEKNDKSLKNYRDKKFFISYEADPSKKNEFKDQQIIDREDMETVMLIDENKRMLKSQKNVWNKKKMKYSKILVDDQGSRLDGRERLRQNQKEKANSLKKKFKSWKNTNSVNLLKEGSQVDKEHVKKFADMFKDRKKQKFKTSNKQKTDEPRVQIRTAQQLLKIKRKGIVQKKINTSKQTKKIRKNKQKKR